MQTQICIEIDIADSYNIHNLTFRIEGLMKQRTPRLMITCSHSEMKSYNLLQLTLFLLQKVMDGKAKVSFRLTDILVTTSLFKYWTTNCATDQ